MKFDQLYQQLMEAMSRRNFLGLMGKGAAAAGLAPKGMIGKTLINTAMGKPIDIDKAIFDYIKLTYANDEASTTGTIKALTKSFSSILSALQQKNLADDKVTKEIKTVLHHLSPEKLKEYEKNGGNIEDFFTDFVENAWDQDATDEIMRVAYDNNLLSPTTVKFLEEYGMGAAECKTLTPEEKRKQQEELNRLDKEEQDRVFKDGINYSRADKAGGSEDEGYAKYYESKKS